MGFFDNIFSGWTGNPTAYKQGMGQIQNIFNTTQGQIGGNTNQALDFLRNYGNIGRTDIGNGYGGAEDVLRGFGNEGIDTLQRYGGQGIDTLRGSNVDAIAALRGGLDKAYAPVEAALGTSFKESPGYRYTVDQGLDAINRSRNARGMAGSGNTDVDALKYAEGEANKDYYNWTDRLAGLGQAHATGAGNIAGLISSGGRDLAGAQLGLGRDLSGAQFGLGQGLSGLRSGAADRLAALASGTGKNLADVLGGSTNAQAALGASGMKSFADLFQQQGKSQIEGSKNMFGDIGNIFKAIASFGMG